MSEEDEDAAGLRSHTTTRRRCLPLICSPLKTLCDSLRILLLHRRLFLPLFALTALPLSLLLFSLSLSVHPLAARVLSLESLARLCPTRFEARQVYKESRAIALSLLHTRAAYFLPCLSLSLIAAVSAVSSSYSALSGGRPTLRSSLAGSREKFPRAITTAICVYVSMWIYYSVPAMLIAVIASRTARFLILVLGFLVEIYLMAVLAMGFVVSVVEDRFGVDAIRVGSGLIAGRKWSGWALSGFFVGVTAWIWGSLEKFMDGQDWTSLAGFARWLVGIRRRVWMIPLYGVVVLWSYAAMTVFYWECKRGQHCNNNNNGSGDRNGDSDHIHRTRESELIPSSL